MQLDEPDRVDLTQMLGEAGWNALTSLWWLIALLVAVAILQRVEFRRGPRPHRRPHGRHRESTARRQPSEPSRSDASRLGDPKAQMEFIANVEFEPRRLLNRREYAVLQVLERVARQIAGGHRVMAQTSLGETIAPRGASGSEQSRDLAFRSINSKRLDFLIIDRFGMPALAVEYQGHGHYRNRAFMRDAVKREAVRKAGIPFLEIPAEYDPMILEHRIRSALRPKRRADRNRGIAPDAPSSSGFRKAPAKPSLKGTSMRTKRRPLTHPDRRGS